MLETSECEGRGTAGWRHLRSRGRKEEFRGAFILPLSPLLSFTSTFCGKGVEYTHQSNKYLFPTRCPDCARHRGLISEQNQTKFLPSWSLRSVGGRQTTNIGSKAYRMLESAKCTGRERVITRMIRADLITVTCKHILAKSIPSKPGENQ